MTLQKIFVAGELYSIAKQFSRKGDAQAHAEVARRTGLFKSVRVAEIGKTHPLRKQGKYAMVVRGIARNIDGLTAKGLMKEVGAPDKLEYNRRTGKLKNW